MESNQPFPFSTSFSSLTGKMDNFPWQARLFHRLLEHGPPHLVDLPTGTGKTSIMHLWLLALAAQVSEGRPVSLPRRLVWVVDRRVVVDQATTEAEQIRERLLLLQNAQLRDALAQLCLPLPPDESPLAVSTLRGERQDNGDWRRDPSRPAIIIGTVDMVGSRLLFSGYGDSYRRRPLHAALLGQDALIVNDEAHLTPAFAQLIRAVERRKDGARPLKTMLLTATHRDNASAAFPDTLQHDMKHPVFSRRFSAEKSLKLIAEGDGPAKDFFRKLALTGTRRTLVFVNSPATAAKLAVDIANAQKTTVPVLTGTMRGWERDQLLGKPEMQPFLSTAAPLPNAPPCWLVATSAGEVGINLSADMVITELTTADGLLQRFGRLNRFGETNGEAVVILPGSAKLKKLPAELTSTIEYLRTLTTSGVSPKALRSNPPPTCAFSAQPHLAPLHSRHVDVWSMTSIPASEWTSRPRVELWLHGALDRQDLPETWVAWRRDVPDLVKEGISPEDLEAVFEVYPILGHERLKSSPKQLQEELQQSVHATVKALLITAGGEIITGAIEDLVGDLPRLGYATLVLPPGAGAVQPSGLVDWGSTSTENADVSDLCPIPQRKSLRIRTHETEPETGLRLRFILDLPDSNAEEADSDEAAPLLRWCYYSGPPKSKTSGNENQELEIHRQAVAEAAQAIANRLRLDPQTSEVVTWAAYWHDAGKASPIWQLAAGNPDGPPLAKCRRLNGRLLAGFRHELSSLVEAEAHLPSHFSPIHRNLGLHLIAAHHGWARPHFTRKAYNRDRLKKSEARALAAASRFGVLQQHYGAWGLAYLESLVRCADAMASAATELPVYA